MGKDDSLPYSSKINEEVIRYPESVQNASTVPQFFRETVENKPEGDYALIKEDLKWTFVEYLENVERTALAFINMGLEPLGGVGIIGFNSPEWFCSFYGSIFAGGVAVGIYSTNNASACAYVIEDANCQIVVTQDDKQTQKVIANASTLKTIKAVVQYAGSVDELKTKNPNLPFEMLNWGEMMEKYAPSYEENQNELQERAKDMSPFVGCSIVYTSGTTGNPKGAIITHDNFVHMVKSVLGAVEKVSGGHDHTLVSYLPLSHIMAQITDMGCILAIGGTTVFAQPDALKGSLGTTLAQHSPTVLVGVPRVFEKMQASIEALLMKQFGLVRWTIRTAFATVLRANQALVTGQPVPWGTAFAKSIVYGLKYRSGLHRIIYAISGGAPLLEDTQNFWLKLDIPVCQGYGLSEVTGPHVAQYPVGTMDDMQHFAVGSVGKVMNPEYKIKIDPHTDEVLLAGRDVFNGYVNKHTETEEVFQKIDGDWFFKTGDQGRLDESGNLCITGRLKELIVTAGGENVPPVPIEESIKSHCEDLISNVLVIGDRRKFLSCFVTLKSRFETREDGQEWPTDELTSWVVRCLEREGINGINTVSQARKNETIRQKIENAIKKYNKTEATSSAQCVQKFEILEQDFSIASGDLGPTLKLKRNVVVEKLKAETDKFYPED